MNKKPLKNPVTMDDVINLLGGRLGEIERQMIATPPPGTTKVSNPFEGVDEMGAIMELIKFYDKKLFGENKKGSLGIQT